MLKHFFRCIAVLTIIVSTHTHAFPTSLPVIEADAFVAGDHKAAQDISTGLVWMDFGVNQNESYTQVVSKLTTEYKGWRVPTEAEAKQLWLDLFTQDPFNPLPLSNFTAYLDTLFSVFGSGWDWTYQVMNENGEITDSWRSRSAFGIFKSEAETVTLFGFSHPYDNIHNIDLLFVDIASTDFDNWYGTLLVKADQVPEPSSILLMGIGLLGLILGRRRTN